MDLTMLFTSVLGLLLILLPLMAGARHFEKWRSENRRLERRMQDWK